MSGGGVFKISQHFKTLAKFDQIAEIMNKERGRKEGLRGIKRGVREHFERGGGGKKKEGNLMRST